MNELLYGAAYYDEYMPYDRLDKDVEMLKKAGMNVVRIAESTWSTMEPSDGVFDFHHIDRVLDAMYKAGIHVIVGTPTYAVPAWMVRKHPDILAETRKGAGVYGHRQIMDITNEHYLFYAERAIRKLMEHVKDHPAIIGYQLDNETKHYDTCGPKVQARFTEWLKEKFHNDTEEMNKAFGFNYWSNAIHDWKDVPDVRGTINGSFWGEYEKFRRMLVTEFLKWQSGIVREYIKPDQFITHNFDFGWKGYSYGVQPDVNHFTAADALTVAGCDIYHPSQDHLTGMEIAFGGALNYGLKKNNYLILETEAQGFAGWTPYDGQLRLLAFSHLGSGADMVEYWHWHSIHNACETYWKGVLSHDFSENHVYKEAATVGADFKRLSKHLLHLKKNNKVAVMVNNESLTGLEFFYNTGGYVHYNEAIMETYRALYEMNAEADVITSETEDLSSYKVIVLPAMYCASEDVLKRLKQFAAEGGTLIGTFKTAFTDENVQVYSDTQPHILHDVFGIQYNQFSIAEDMEVYAPASSLKNTLEQVPSVDPQTAVNGFFECVETCGAETILSYVHDNWSQYAAATRNDYEKGHGWYIGCMLPKEILKSVLQAALTEAGVETCTVSAGFPVIVKTGVNPAGKKIVYVYNYSGRPQFAKVPEGRWTELLEEKELTGGDDIRLDKWGFVILEEK